MNEIISSYLSNLKFGDMQTFKNITIVPILTDLNHSPKYITLDEALKKNLVIVTEVDEFGSVPTLKVKNNADTSVLMLAGEELVGAKQNRILNTTILLKRHSETVIPVSCTEAGRWSSVSARFKGSEVIAPPKIRKLNTTAVAESLRNSRSFESDQAAVWEEIYEISRKAKVASPTEAMDDVFKQKESNLDDYLEAFPSKPHQKGLFVFINGKDVGFDFISLESAYEKLHSKLVKSYAMDAILQGKKSAKKDSMKKVEKFIDSIKASKEEKFKSVSNGWDYRYTGNKVVGSAFLYRKKVIHMSFFKAGKADTTGNIADYRTRRWFIH